MKNKVLLVLVMKGKTILMKKNYRNYNKVFNLFKETRQASFIFRLEYINDKVISNIN